MLLLLSFGKIREASVCPQPIFDLSRAGHGLALRCSPLSAAGSRPPGRRRCGRRHSPQPPSVAREIEAAPRLITPAHATAAKHSVPVRNRMRTSSNGRYSLEPVTRWEQQCLWHNGIQQSDACHPAPRSYAMLRGDKLQCSPNYHHAVPRRNRLPPIP